MCSGQLTQADLFEKKLMAPVGQLGLAGKILAGHGGAAVAAEAAGLAGAGVVGDAGGSVERKLGGSSVCGKVARLAAAGSVGKYSGPRWPQADRLTALAPRTIALTRILEESNMVKL